MNVMTVKTGTLCVAALLIGAVHGETYTLTSVRGDTETVAVGACWSGGIAPLEDNAAGHDFIDLIGNFRTPGSTAAFKCNSLTIDGAGTTWGDWSAFDWGDTLPKNVLVAKKTTGALGRWRAKGLGDDALSVRFSLVDGEVRADVVRCGTALIVR